MGKNDDKITVIISNLEGSKKTKHYKDMRLARKFAIQHLGDKFEIRDKYAESATKPIVCLVKNATLEQLLVDALPESKGTGKGKKARQSKVKDGIMELLGIYIENPDTCEELFLQIEDGFVIYKKPQPKE